MDAFGEACALCDGARAPVYTPCSWAGCWEATFALLGVLLRAPRPVLYEATPEMSCEAPWGLPACCAV